MPLEVYDFSNDEDICQMLVRPKIRVIGDEPIIMSLSATPYIQPTHTGRNDDTSRLSPSFSPNAEYGVKTNTSAPANELVDRFVATSDQFVQTMRHAAEQQTRVADRFKETLAADDLDEVEESHWLPWEEVYQGHIQICNLGDRWNPLTPRINNLNDE